MIFISAFAFSILVQVLLPLEEFKVLKHERRNWKGGERNIGGKIFGSYRCGIC